LRSAMLINPIMLALATAIAVVTAKVLGLNPHLSSILIAAAIGLVAAEVALLPIVLSVSKNPAEIFQRAFAGTVLHLLAAVILGAVAVFGLKLGGSFVFWLLGSYWITLSGLCIVFIRLFRSPVEPSHPPVEPGQLSAN